MLNSSIAASFQRAPVLVADASLEDRIQALLQDAGRSHQQGDLARARSLYLDILALSGEQAQALFLLALVSFQLGDWGFAKHGLNQYLKQHSQDLTAWGLLGQCLLALGEHANAVEIFKNLVYLEPDQVEHVTELARAYRAWGGDHGDLAREALRQAHWRSPHDEKVLSALSELYMEQQGFDRALPLLQALCEMHPLNAHHHLNLGLAHQGLGQSQQAQSHYAKAIELDTALPAAHYNWGVLLQDEGQDDLAIEQYRCALRLDPGYAAVYLNLSVLLCQRAGYNEALQVLDEAVRHGVQSDELYFCKGMALERLNRPHPAMENFEKAIELNPAHAKAHWNLGLICLRLGLFERGWAEHEWRWQVDSFKPLALSTSKPPWTGKGSVLAPQRLLVWAEQGLGDEIMFASLLRETRQRVQHLLVQVDGRLLEVMRRSMPDIEFLPKEHVVDEALYDAHSSMGSLAQWCRHNAAAFAAQPQGYLLADASRVQRLREGLPTAVTEDQPVTCRVGVSWRSLSRESGERRSLDLSELALAIHAPGVLLVSLQYGEVDEDIQTCWAQTGIRVHQVHEVDNFSDVDGLMALIAAMDAVVSVDNVTVHMGGALNQPVLALLPLESDWRWMQGVAQSPWYPSVQLLRQTHLNDWRHVTTALKHLFNS